MKNLSSYGAKKALVILAMLFCVTSLTVIAASAQQQQQQSTGSSTMFQQMGSMVQQMGPGTMTQQMVTNSGTLVQKMPGFEQKDIIKLGQDNVIRMQIWKDEQGETVHQLVWLDRAGRVFGQQAWVVNKDGSVTSQQQQIGPNGGTMIQTIGPGGTIVQQVPVFQQKDILKLGQEVIRERTWQGEGGSKVHQLVWLDPKGEVIGQQAWAVSKDGKTISMQQQSTSK